MRLLLAMMKHETNTFSPVLTDLARFARAGGVAPDSGDAAIAAYRGTGTVTGAYIEIAEREGASFELAIAADAWPSGPVEDDAYEAICAPILAAVRRRGFDAILLDLRGAMITRSHEDGEGTLPARIRAVDPSTPLAVSCDMHANLYPAMVQHANVVAGYQTHPHIDMHETALRAGNALVRMLKSQVSLGIDPMQKRYVMLKSRIHWRAGMAHLASAVVECTGVGVCTSDYGQHDFKRLRRPIYPLDPQVQA